MTMPGGNRNLSEEGRRRQSEAARAYWAGRRAAASQNSSPSHLQPARAPLGHTKVPTMVVEGMHCPVSEPSAQSSSPSDISTAWVAKHRAAIRFQAGRGMSRASLCRIYGRDTVMAVLDPMGMP